jgi:putative glutathione S-transferase
MGLLVDGTWQDRWYDTQSSGGSFERQSAQFRGWVAADGSTPFAPEVGRYHLYVSYACPWAHRVLVVRGMMGLEHAISVSVVEPLMLENGWEFSSEFPDHVGGQRFLYELYAASQPKYTGRATVPVLWDRKTNTIVNNESSDIIRILNREFASLAARVPDLYPSSLRSQIDSVNQRVYDTVNNGVYRCGFATTQAAYEEAFDELFASLDWLEGLLGESRFLVSPFITEADIRLFTTLLRFDLVYYGHFKTNLRRLVDYPNLWAYTRELYQESGVRETVHLDHIKKHYYASHRTINPTGVVPKGPVLDFAAPHHRERYPRETPPHQPRSPALHR